MVKLQKKTYGHNYAFGDKSPKRRDSGEKNRHDLIADRNNSINKTVVDERHGTVLAGKLALFDRLFVGESQIDKI